MRVWNDHVDVWNGGELPAGYTLETLLGQHSSRPRNKNIANAFFKAGFIDAWGRGYKKIHDGFESAGLPMPEVENFCGGVRVSFKRNNVNHGHQDVLGNIGGISASQLTERQRKIVDRLVETGQWNALENVLENVLETSATLAALFGVDARTIRRDLNTLQSKGVIRRDGPDRGGRRVILKKIEP